MMHSMGLRATPVGEKRCFGINRRELKRWTDLPEIPHPRIHPTLITVANRYCYSIGGFEDFYFDIFVFDIEQWKIDKIVDAKIQAMNHDMQEP